MGDSAYFFQLFADLVLHFRGHFGMLGKYPTQKNIAPFARFYVGGTTPDRALRGKECITLRGYRDNYFTPVDVTTGYKGGVIYDKFAFELRYPIISSYFASVYALTFAEAGNTWAQYGAYNLLDLKKSAGVGLRAYLPFLIGTIIGINWGYGFDKSPTDSGEDTLKFHFSIGPDLR